MAAYKHFTLIDRIDIEHYLKDGLSFKAIGREMNRDCTTVAKEIKRHIIHKITGAFGRAYNSCIHRMDCTYSYLCDNPACKNRYCRFCSKCNSVCNEYEEESCSKLLKAPYVCNGCDQLKVCRLEKSIYSAAAAQKQYESLRSESRIGINIDEVDAVRLDNIISPLVRQGQSIHHICVNNTDAIMCSERTIYNYVSLSLFSARNLDLPRKVRYRPRRKSKSSFKVDKSCRIGRTYDDFMRYLDENQDTSVVQMDTVEGVKGGKVLLTLHFRQSGFMLAFIRDANTSRSVINIFDRLYCELSPDMFAKLFPVILTDNGSEFTNPSAIEFDAQGNQRTRIFYCDPSAPYQKGAIENNHELIRRVIPKGCSFNDFNQGDINVMMNHINSYSRKKLNNQSPYQLFSFIYGTNVLKKLGAVFIPCNEILLKPELLTK